RRTRLHRQSSGWTPLRRLQLRPRPRPAVGWTLFKTSLSTAGWFIPARLFSAPAPDPFASSPVHAAYCGVQKDRFYRHVFIAFALVLVVYVGVFSCDQRVRQRKGPWQVTFFITNNVPAIRVSQPF